MGGSHDTPNRVPFRACGDASRRLLVLASRHLRSRFSLAATRGGGSVLPVGPQSGSPSVRAAPLRPFDGRLRVDRAGRPQGPRRAQRLSLSPVAIDTNAIITRAYQDILGREPDPAGVQSYRRHMIQDGWSEQDVRQVLRQSPEYSSTTGRTASADGIVRRAYRDVLHREPDQSGLDSYRRAILENGWDEQDVRRALRHGDDRRGQRGRAPGARGQDYVTQVVRNAYLAWRCIASPMRTVCATTERAWHKTTGARRTSRRPCATARSTGTGIAEPTGASGSDQRSMPRLDCPRRGDRDTRGAGAGTRERRAALTARAFEGRNHSRSSNVIDASHDQGRRARCIVS